MCTALTQLFPIPLYKEQSAGSLCLCTIAPVLDDIISILRRNVKAEDKLLHTDVELDFQVIVTENFYLFNDL